MWPPNPPRSLSSLSYLSPLSLSSLSYFSAPQTTSSRFPQISSPNPPRGEGMRPLWASTSDRDPGAASCSWRWRADPLGDELLPPSDRREFFLPVTGASSSSRRPAQARAGGRPRAARVDPPRRREGEKRWWLTVFFLFPANFSFPVLFLLSHTLFSSDLSWRRRMGARPQILRLSGEGWPPV